MSRLTEANKFFFGTENTAEVKRLFESVSDEKALYKEICQIFVENAGFEYLDDTTAVPNMFTGPCIMKTDKYTHIIGFGAFAKSKGYKTGTKVDKLKIHVITDRKLKHSYPHTHINSGHIEPEEIGESLNFIPTYNSDCANILCDEAVYFDLIGIMKNEGIIDKLNMLFPILDKHHYGI